MKTDNERADRGRFAPGQSGNSNGRPRASKTVSAAIVSAMNKTVTANENGRKRQVRKLDATATQLANKGASGDLRAGKILLDMAAKAEAQQEAVRPSHIPLSQSDAQIVERFLSEYREHIENGDAS